jgi:hypothetical protein
MKLAAFLPPHFKDLIQYVPTILFEVTEWTSLLIEAKHLSLRLINPTGKTEVIEQLSAHLPTSIKFSVNTFNYKELSLDQKEFLAKQILEFYFIQVLSPGAKFLDLSLEHFGLDQTTLSFDPSNLWSEFSVDFQEGIKNIYLGFYMNAPAQFQQGLREVKLIDPIWSKEDQDQMSELFYKHFGISGDEKIKFRTSAFQASFHEVFKFLLKKKIKISPDFLKLGIMLVTLYTALETLDLALSPKEAFVRALKNTIA